ncbi:MAG: hypothetical protein M1826_003133 [Phylliscum demangeonii]|nr:MAG: hypothetical protein M1826_003133 [Phylliscum demangeonii]
MGIKGLYHEIGPGERIALSKLAMDTFEQRGRPLRVAIDTALWQFQAQSGKGNASCPHADTNHHHHTGGKNPALRTIYYRLLRLLALSIQPLLVFDGPDKPPFKRGRRTGPHVEWPLSTQLKQLLGLLGLPHHDAPGEAEAECARLQQHAVVDAVLSEDVDALMFGCGLTLRDWSAEGRRGPKAPTHVSMYRCAEAESAVPSAAGGGGDGGATRPALTAAGMLLVALMSGGDYSPAGVPRCGVKVACEAARAGYGEWLCRLGTGTPSSAGWQAWRHDLAHELRTNEQKFFKTKHPTIVIPPLFPDRDLLRYYLRPAVSSPARLQALRQTVRWEAEIDVRRLRRFVADAFEWRGVAGARKFVRGVAEPLLVQGLVRRALRSSSAAIAPAPALDDAADAADAAGVREICGRRTAFTTDGLVEVRVSFVPLDIVRIDLSLEAAAAVINQDDPDPDPEPEPGEHHSSSSSSSSSSSDDDDNHDMDDASSTVPEKRPARRTAPSYDPSLPHKAWVCEGWVRAAAPAALARWHDAERLRLQERQDRLAAAAAKPSAAAKRSQAAARRALKLRGGMEFGAMDRYVRITKPAAHHRDHHPLPKTVAGARKVDDGDGESESDGGGGGDDRGLGRRSLTSMTAPTLMPSTCLAEREENEDEQDRRATRTKTTPRQDRWLSSSAPFPAPRPSTVATPAARKGVRQSQGKPPPGKETGKEKEEGYDDDYDDDEDGKDHHAFLPSLTSLLSPRHPRFTAPPLLLPPSTPIPTPSSLPPPPPPPAPWLPLHPPPPSPHPPPLTTTTATAPRPKVRPRASLQGAWADADPDIGIGAGVGRAVAVVDLDGDEGTTMTRKTVTTTARVGVGAGAGRFSASGGGVVWQRVDVVDLT